MSFKTDKVAAGQEALTLNVLDVSGNIRISALAGSGTRMVTASPDGSLGAQDIGGGGATADVFGFFGDGALGDVTLDASITLSRDMFYKNLTINNGVWLNTAGFVVRVFGTLTINSGGHVACDGGNGVSATSNVGGAGGTPPYTITSGAFPFQGTATNGGSGITSTSSSTANADGLAGGISNNSVLYNPPPIIRAGTGGGGGGCHGSATGGTTGFAGNFAAGIGGAGKTGSGTGSASLGGGGGGAGGGVLIIYANTINNAGSIHANGGNGGAGYLSGSNSGGGGGGGGGGVVLVFYRNTTGSGLGTRQALGGTKGANGNSATGSDGNTGVSFSYRM